MSTLDDGPSASQQPAASSRPSLLGATPAAPAAAGTAAQADASNRILAHLEGRKSPSSAGRLLSVGVVTALVLGAGGFGAWHFTRDAAPAATPAQKTPVQVALADPQPQAAADPALQPARIVEETPGQATPATSSAGSPLSSLDAAVAATTPLAAALPFASSTAQAAPAHATTTHTANTNTHHHAAASNKTRTAKSGEAKPVRVAQASTTKKPVQQRKPATRTQPAVAPVQDPDADLLAALLQRRDPRPASATTAAQK
ncbi:MAG: hypothetical protein GAK30_01364 [Paracidovorax wautersii]|uniref:Uncharacterized protein n=1 Tax=Paracidovorax wautersii TaxID=1177982 RepID=A0A7V8FPX5_9BURK|nr:MAG: hypothetical protein GAK30_01364 [Paracidovorax wautersii]